MLYSSKCCRCGKTYATVLFWKENEYVCPRCEAEEIIDYACIKPALKSGICPVCGTPCQHCMRKE
jgi:hypothetical protein